MPVIRARSLESRPPDVLETDSWKVEITISHERFKDQIILGGVLIGFVTILIAYVDLATSSTGAFEDKKKAIAIFASMATLGIG